MGNVSSSLGPVAGGELEGEHFLRVTQTVRKQSVIELSKSRTNIGANDAKGMPKIEIAFKARVLRCISCETLWSNFVSSSASGFALTFAETSALLLGTLTSDGRNAVNSDSAALSTAEIQAAIDSYLEVTKELNGGLAVNMIDFMALCSSVLLLSSTSIEAKVDQLFEWITIGDGDDSFSFEDLFVALNSFEKGLSIAMGKKPCSEEYNKKNALDYMAQADPSYSTKSQKGDKKISQKQFFDLCTCRQLSVRRLLEAAGASKICAVGADSDVSVAVDRIMRSPSGGDEFMANPAWKKTAEKMTPVGTFDTSAPSSSLSLEWVHGYRGYDCRNNVRYADDLGSEILYTAAALTIIQSRKKNKTGRNENGNDRKNDKSNGDKRQFYFGEHTDDVISIAIHTKSYDYDYRNTNNSNNNDDNSNDNDIMIASGEIRKNPAINIYRWNYRVKLFESLSSPKGFHTVGISQLDFSNSGNRLFSVGIDYTVAVYDTEKGSKSFGKMIFSSLGPKSKVLHLSHCGVEGEDFTTCGEKHLIYWRKKGATYVQENGKLGNLNQKSFMSIVSGLDGRCFVGTSDGDLLQFQGCELIPAGGGTHDIRKDGKDRKIAVNALYSQPCKKNPESFILVSGGRDGSVIVWGHFKGGLQRIVDFNLFGHSGGSTPPIRSVCISKDKKNILIGTQTCEILEFSKLDGETFCENKTKNLSNSELKVSAHVQGHYQNELWGLAVMSSTGHNGTSNDEYCTTGDDGYLRLWSVRHRLQTLCLDMKASSRCCCYSPDGSLIAVGFGGAASKQGKQTEDGIVRIYRIERNSDFQPLSFQLLKEIKEAKRWISCISFSPDGSTLGVGARDNSIYLYSTSMQYKRRAKFSKHNAGVNQFDFSKDGKAIQSCCSAYEILFSDAITGAHIPQGPTSLLGVDWSTWTLTLGWAVQGIWTGAMDGSDVNAADRSPTQQLLATGDDFGKVTVYRYPCLQPGISQGSAYTGHSSHVTQVRWIGSTSTSTSTSSAKDEYLISLGGDDKCIFQWKVENNSDERATPLSATVEVEERGSVGSSNNLDVEAGPTGGDEFAAVKPWLGAIVPPTAWSESLIPMGTKGMKGTKGGQSEGDKIAQSSAYYTALSEFSVLHAKLRDKVEGGVSDSAVMNVVYSEVRASARKALAASSVSGVLCSAAPDMDELELEWVHGIRSFDTRNNVRYILPVRTNTNNELGIRGQRGEERGGEGGAESGLVYHAAALGIYLDPINKIQKYFRGHTDDVMALCVLSATLDDPLKSASAVIATGQQGEGNIFVWEAPSMTTLSVLNTKQKSVMMLEFSSDGRLLFSVGEDKSVAVSDWRAGTVIATVKGEPAVTHHVAASSYPMEGATCSFLTVGDKFIKLWSLKGRNLTAGKVILGKSGSPQGFLCCAAVGASFVIGCEDGSLYVLSDGKNVQDRKYSNLTGNVKGQKTGSGKEPPVTAIFYSNGILLTGNKEGSVVVWNTENLNKLPITAPEGLSFLLRFELFNIPSSVLKSDVQVSPPNSVCVSDLVAKQIQSLCYRLDNSDGNRNSAKIVILLSTRGCDVLEISCCLRRTFSPQLFCSKNVPQSSHNRSNDGVLMRGHCNDELWGLGTHPTQPLYCTVGDDKTLRFWDLHKKCMVQAVPLGTMARTCTYSPNGLLVAVGFGGRVGRGKESNGGMLRIYSTADPANLPVLKLVEHNDAKQWISDLKFSSDGSTLAVGSHDCKIYVYDVKVEVQGPCGVTALTTKLRTTFVKHNSVINHLDISQDGRFIQSNCSAYELLFSDTHTGKQLTSATELRDVQWGSWTCTLGWPVQGIWPLGADGSDINAVDRSHSGHLIATSDDDGRLKLFRYPCVGGSLKSGPHSVSSAQAHYLEYPGHASHVMNVKWTVGDEAVLSVGGNDKCIFQWRHSMSLRGNPAPSSPGELDDTSDAFAHSATSSKSTELHLIPSGGDESGCVKPWLGAIKAPKVPPPLNPGVPAVTLDLKWVHGYTSGVAGSRGGQGVRVSNNLYYNSEGDIVYPAASLGVKLTGNQSTTADSSSNSPPSATQSFFTGHDDDIMCLAMSPCRLFIATGQTASRSSKGKSKVCVWDAIACRMLTCMVGCHQRGVLSLSFSPSSSQLLSVGQDDQNTHILWTDLGGMWSKVQQTVTEKSDRNPVYFSIWVNPKNKITRSEYQIISGGGGINFWKIEGSHLSKKAGRFGTKFKQSPIACVGNLNMKEGWRVVAGASSGDLLIFEDREVIGCVESAHPGSVLCIAEVKVGDDVTHIVTGGKDRTVRVWNSTLQPVGMLEVGSSLSLRNGCVGSLDVKPVTSDGGLVLLVGTQGGEIIEFGGEKDRKSGMDLVNAKSEIVLHSHSGGELWGLATHPTNPEIYVTVGDDSMLRVWNVRTDKMVYSVELGWPARSVCFHPSGEILAIGFMESQKGVVKKEKKNEKNVNNLEGDKKNENKTENKTKNEHTGAVHLYSFKINLSNSNNSMNNNSQIMMQKIAFGCSTTAWVNDVNISPSGKLLSVSSHDKKIYFYDLPNFNSGEYISDWNDCLKKEKFVFDKHSSAVLHTDFSSDGKYLQTDSQSGELLFIDLEKRKQEPSATKVADYNALSDGSENENTWHSQSCVLGWAVLGIWPPVADGSDVNSAHRNANRKYLATGDDFGQVKIFNYPCATEGSKFLACDGHSSHVTNVRWTSGDEGHLVSTGGNDNCVFVWHLNVK